MVTPARAGSAASAKISSSHRPTSPGDAPETTREAGARAARVLPPGERKALHPIPILRSGSSPGASPLARVVPVASEPPPFMAHLGLETQTLPPMHEGIVKISTTQRVLMARAVVAEMDEGLVIASRGLHLDGVCSVGFASCLALMFSNSEGVGLVHSSGIRGLEADIQEAQEEFVLRSGRPARLRIGYNLDAYRAQMWEEAKRTTANAFARENRCTPAAQGCDEVAEKARVIDIVLGRHQQRVELLAQNHGADCVLMPRSFVALATDGTVHLFEGLATGVKFRPVT